jgi:O-antigen/teichoic acid export membrane protein
MVIPTYQYLMAKGYPEKTIIIQVLNVIVNGSLFFITLPLFGYYSAVIGNVGAILSSFLLTLFYQKKYLNCLILDNFKQLAKYFLILTFNIIIGLVLSVMIDLYILKIILTPVVLILSSILAFRVLKIFTREEIRKFSDKENLLIKVADKILIQNH